MGGRCQRCHRCVWQRAPACRQGQQGSHGCGKRVPGHGGYTVPFKAPLGVGIVHGGGSIEIGPAGLNAGPASGACRALARACANAIKLAHFIDTPDEAVAQR